MQWYRLMKNRQTPGRFRSPLSSRYFPENPLKKLRIGRRKKPISTAGYDKDKPATYPCRRRDEKTKRNLWNIFAKNFPITKVVPEGARIRHKNRCRELPTGRQKVPFVRGKNAI